MTSDIENDNNRPQTWVQPTAEERKLQQKLRNARDTLNEVNEVLTEMGWSGNRGLLYRVRKAYKETKFEDDQN